MRATPVLLLVAGLGVIVWLAPGLKGNASAPDAASAPAPAPVKAASARGAVNDPGNTGWTREGTRLQRAADGHFYADVAIDGQSVRMLVDTGASVVALTGDDASALGLHWNAGDVRPVARGASGMVMGVPVMLDSVSLNGGGGGFAGQGDAAGAANVSAIIVPEGLGISLLGQSALESLGPVRINGDTMVLGGS